MNNLTQSDFNKDENQSYDNLSLKELKEMARERQIVPEGNETKKDTWISALMEDDLLTVNSTNSLRIDRTELENPIVEPKGSKEAENYILENIVTALDQRRIDVNQLQINFDGQNIFKMNKGNIANSTVTNQQKELIEQALNDPASFRGSIKITNGGQVLLHVKDGQVIRDGLNITKPSTKVEISSAPGDLYDKHAKSVNSKGLKATKDVAVNALAAGIEPKQVKEIIESKDPAYADLQASSGKNSADRALDKIIASAEAEIKLKQQEQPARTKQPALFR